MNLHRLLFLLAILLLIPLLVQAQNLTNVKTTGPVDITAEELQYDRAKNVYTARGDVELREGARSLKADFVTYNDITEDVLAEGNVVLREEGDRVEAQRLTVNLASRLGTIEKGRIFIEQGNFYITGQEITKTGEATYVVRKGEFTTCGWEKPAWKFQASDVKITVQGYATAKSAKFSILGTPVFYVPWGVFPVVTQRQSGFLLPDFTLSSRDGPIFADAFYWAIAKDKDATFFLDLIGKRGVKPGAEFRYALSDTLKGEWYGSIIDDRDYDHTRYQIRGEHQQVLLGDLSFKTRINQISDIDYLQDFRGNPEDNSENMIKSTAFVEKPFGDSLLTVETTYFKTLLQKDNDSTYKYLPFMSYFLQYLPVLNNIVYVNLASDVLNLYREQGDKYSRFILAPSLNMPYYWKGLNFLFGATGYEKLYAVDPDQPDSNWDTHNIESFKLEADVNAQFIKNSSTTWFRIGEFQSLIKPRLRYTYIPDTATDDIPQIDPTDQISELNAVSYSFNHYLTALSKTGVREISAFEIGQTFSLSGDLPVSEIYGGSGRRLSDIYAKLTLYPRAGLSTVHESQFNPYGDGFRIFRNSVNLSSPPYFRFYAGQNYTRDLVNELNTGFIGSYGDFDGIVRVRYSFKDSTWVESLYGITYHPKCWSVTLSLSNTKRPNDTSVKISFDLAGITQRTGSANRIGNFR